MRVSARADYAVRAMIELAASNGESMQGEEVAEAQGIPLHFLESILGELRKQELVQSRRDDDGGGYALARAPAEITVADVVGGVEGTLASVRGELPQQVPYSGTAEPLQQVWVALRSNILAVLDQVTLADLVANEVPDPAAEPSRPPDAPDPR
jgi:Rrf2 family protein